jgi:hypothetical protein
MQYASQVRVLYVFRFCVLLALHSICLRGLLRACSIALVCLLELRHEQFPRGRARCRTHREGCSVLTKALPGTVELKVHGAQDAWWVT